MPTKKNTMELPKISQTRKSLRQFRFRGAGSRAKDVHEGRNLRKTIARALTAQNASQ